MDSIFREEKQLPRRSDPSAKEVEILQLFQLRADRVSARGLVPACVQDIRFAADLTVFNILLPRSRRRIYAGFIPFTTSGALIACVHDRS